MPVIRTETALSRTNVPEAVSRVLDAYPFVLRGQYRPEGDTAMQVLESNGQEAIQLSQSFSDAILILLTDIMMPGLDGGQVASIIHETRPKTKIVFMSGYMDILDDKFDHFTSPNTLLLKKPLSVPELLDTIDSVAYRSDDDEPN